MSIDIVEQLTLTLTSEVDILLDIEDEITDLEAKRKASQEVIFRTKRAINALTGTMDRLHPIPEETMGGQESQEPLVQLETKPLPIPSRSESTRVNPSRNVSGPSCPACGGELEPGSRTLSNGRVVNLLICRDGGCNNEVIAA